MKRIAVLVAIFSFTLTASAFAAATVSVDFNNAGKNVSGDGKTLGKLSSSVTLGASNASTGYAIITLHQKGTRTFGTSHDSTAIYSAEGAQAAPTQSDSGAFGTGWTAM